MSSTRPEEPYAAVGPLQPGDGLIVVDVQHDFLPGGALGVPQGDEIVPALNRYIERFRERGLPVILTRDWHPPDHCSFHAAGGPWPPHCIAETPGAMFAPGLRIPADAIVLSKATTPEADAYSGFQRTGLADLLHARGCRRVFIGGLATDYCVKATVRDALAAGFDAVLLRDAVRAVNVAEDDGARAVADMLAAGARETTLDQLERRVP
ncbi:MAG: nicotinamidase [Thauera propionica]|jgi:nicotinamidase/pyrazinamidase|uniref:nicotinamidase n=1 Tax=Thauera sp. TaxID=1905334 RepID=UPI002579F5E7|nr:nicotinamidase [Thauera sp.]MDY0046797.1 nicotinamidase [Thauera propionica]